MKAAFSKALYNEMVKNDKIFFLTGDLGFKLWDNQFAAFPERTINCGASEQAMLGIAVGLALEGKIPFVYTITPFFLRAYEAIRLYLNHDNIAVHMVGSGRDKDYAHDGFSHDASDIEELLTPFKNIKQFYPVDKEDIASILAGIISSNNPTFLSLKR